MQKLIIAVGLGSLFAILYFDDSMSRCEGDRCAHPVMMLLLALGGCAVTALLGAETWWIDRRQGKPIGGFFKFVVIGTGVVAAAALLITVLAMG